MNSECIFCVTIWPEPEVCGHPDRNPDPPDYTTGWEKPAFACGCGRGCVSWDDHHERRRNASTIPAGGVDAILDCLLGGELGAAS